VFKLTNEQETKRAKCVENQAFGVVEFVKYSYWRVTE